MQNLRSYTSRSADRLSVREHLALVWILGFALLPIKNFQILQIISLLHFTALIFIIGRIRTATLLWMISFVTLVLGLNMLTGHVRLEVLKPLWGVFAMIALFGLERTFSRVFYERFVTTSFSIMLLFFVVHIANLTVVENIYRESSQGDVIHLSRLTAPFLFAGDLGFVCLFMAMLSFSLQSRRFGLIGIGFLTLLLLTQSRLALAGTPFILLMIPGWEKRLWLFGFTSIAVATLILNIDKFFEMFPYIFRFVDRFEFYVSESKRAIEIMYLYNNFWTIFIGGTDNFVLSDGLDTAESSIVSYAVKSGILATIIFWLSIFMFSIRYLAGGVRLVTLLFLLSALGAPLDRPKSSVFLIVAMAGVSYRLRERAYAPAADVYTALPRRSNNDLG
jgi:hypothetical protein